MATTNRRPFHLYRNLAFLVAAGLIAGLLLTFFYTPGAGSISLGGAAWGMATWLLVLTVAVVALLWHLEAIHVDVAAHAFDGADPAGRSFHVIPEAHEAQHVLTIEGIGEKYATRLNNMGVITIPQLLAANPQVVAQRIDTTTDRVAEWQGMGRLMGVKGIGAQYAEILAMAGVRTVEQLAESDPIDLLARIDRIEASRKVRVLKTDIQAGHVRRFIEAAQGHLVTA